MDNIKILGVKKQGINERKQEKIVKLFMGQKNEIFLGAVVLVEGKKNVTFLSSRIESCEEVAIKTLENQISQHCDIRSKEFERILVREVTIERLNKNEVIEIVILENEKEEKTVREVFYPKGYLSYERSIKEALHIAKEVIYTY